MKEYDCYYKSAHYDFYCKPDSFALKDIAVIAERQEQCYKTITSELNIFPAFRLEYWLADTSQEIGVFYGDGEPCNGFAEQPNKIFAVYNNEVKCIGMHEDAHIISFSIKKPNFAFLSEGLAMYFDGQWQGKSSEIICREMLKRGTMPDVLSLFNNDKFFALGEKITYPLAGTFTRFLVQKLTMPTYLKEVFYNDNAETYLDDSFGDIIKEFLSWLESIQTQKN
ncbi:MAG: hypothetical protein LUD19_02915 [Clostridia bacterium]|nr:hypothetical protein [Clostridia bacterium]